MSTLAAAHDFGFGSARRGAAPRTSEVRLTRRGRLVVLAAFLGLTFVVLTMLSGQSAATRAPGQPVQTHTIVVGEGDTLWDIASDVAEPGQTREMVRYIEELNALPGASLTLGQKLAVPVR